MNNNKNKSWDRNQWQGRSRRLLKTITKSL